VAIDGNGKIVEVRTGFSGFDDEKRIEELVDRAMGISGALTANEL
jgi:hypothetical protein